MARRLQLHEELCSILGSRNVYFQPPESVKLKYDAIVYKIIDRDDLRANDHRYRNLVAYEVTLIYRNPDSEIPNDLFDHFTYVDFNRHFTMDNLHHDIFTIYY